MANKRNFAVVVAIAILAVVSIFAPKSDNKFNMAGSNGFSLKDLNDTTTASLSAMAEVNHTTETGLTQGALVGSYFTRKNNLFFGGDFVGCVSTQFGVCTPVMALRTGVDFGDYQLEYKVGDFKRSTITTAGCDPQYTNTTIVMGDGASASKAMQLSFIGATTKVGFGHMGQTSFYDFVGGTWYVYAEQVFGKVSLSGGLNFAANLSGYAAAKVQFNENNRLSLTANQLGTENQNFILAYNLDNISVGKQNMGVTVSAWNKGKEAGLHLVNSLNLRKVSLFAQLGTNYCLQQFALYGGFGARFILK